VKVKYAVGVLKERLMGILTAEERLVRTYVYRDMVVEIKR
jgi:hypothetical protein